MRRFRSLRRYETLKNQVTTANLAPRFIAGCCHLGNFMGRSQRCCPCILKVLLR